MTSNFEIQGTRLSAARMGLEHPIAARNTRQPAARRVEFGLTTDAMSKHHEKRQRAGTRGRAWAAQLLTCATLVIHATGCAGPRPAVDEVLSQESEAAVTGKIAREDFPLPAEFDAHARTARSAALATPENTNALLRASRALFMAADARVQRASLDHILSLDKPALADVLDAADSTNDATRAEVEALSAEGLEFAERALELEPELPGALLYRAVHSTLLAWSVGPARAVLEGLASKAGNSTKQCLAAGKTQEAAAPLRIRGRFLSKAPWPVGDNEEAIALLQEAVQLAPVTLNWLFLGDALHAQGDTTRAQDAWQSAATAESDSDSAALGAYHRETARRQAALGDG